MPVDNFRDLHAFFVIARERNFTRAAAELGLSQSALSHKIRGLEAKLGVRLLTRTTRSVSPTEAGERLVRFVAPRFAVISAVMSDLGSKPKRPSRTVRIRTCDFAAKTVLLPRLATLNATMPGLKIEIIGDTGCPESTDDTFYMHVQFGVPTTKNVSAVPISEEVPMMIVGAPSYFLGREDMPVRLSDLANHTCLSMRGVGHGDVDAWELIERGKPRKARVYGAWTFSAFSYAVDAAVSGAGLALLPEVLVRDHIAEGRLKAVLMPFWPTWPALHIVHDANEQIAEALSAIVEKLRLRTT